MVQHLIPVQQNVAVGLKVAGKVTTINVDAVRLPIVQVDIQHVMGIKSVSKLIGYMHHKGKTISIKYNKTGLIPVC